MNPTFPPRHSFRISNFGFRIRGLIGVGLLCLLSQAALAVTSGDLALARTFDKTVALTNSPILVTATLTNISTDTIRGFYYFDQLPTGLTVATINVTLGGRSLTNFSFESGQDGDVYAGCTPQRWRLETPTNFTEANVIPPQGIVRVVFSISCASTGTFTLQGFGCAACKPDKTNTLFGYSGTADQQTVTFVSSPPATNTAPVLPAQINRTLLELTALTVTNTAMDTDLPANILSYTLLNPPAGASVNTNGVITWIPAEAQGPLTCVIAMVVTDNGVPALSATNSFTVVVQEINTAPSLPAQTARTIVGLETLVVTNTGTDGDLPSNSLTYQLTSAPAGAVIDANGVITWTPNLAQVPGTNLFLTTVTDDNPWAINSQQLNATNTFAVVVLGSAAPFPISSVSFSNGVVLVSWAAIGGQTYRLQFAETLADLIWHDVVPDVLAAGLPGGNTVATAQDVAGNAPKRFYRILLVK
jgi:hypothetical protein